MVASQGDHAWEGFTLEGRTRQSRVGGGFAGKDGVVASFDLREGEGVVIRGHGDVAAVDYGGPAVKGVGG